MTRPGKKGWMAIFFILACLSIPFAITYYVSTDAYRDRYEEWQTANRRAGVEDVSKSRVMEEKVLLVKDDRLRVCKTELVYRGIREGQILLDLCLLELDPEVVYPQRFSQTHTPMEIRLGDVSYTIFSVSSRALTLTPFESPHSR